ncbi:uncharacterized protein [Clytia hemisphaerica]|uniref:uncharacterized protein n=1 Tax=Clytia hemisphaerica TaxID=252671 RepID=UPI0034D56FBC
MNKIEILIFIGIVLYSYYVLINFLEKRSSVKFLNKTQHTGTVVLALGDSLTEGLYDREKLLFHAYTLELKRLLSKNKKIKDDLTLINAGVSGERTSQIHKRLLSHLVSSQQFTVAIILAGTNDFMDIIRKVGESETHLNASCVDLARQIQALHNMCHSKSIMTVLLTIPEITNERDDKRDVFQKFKHCRTIVNYQLRSYANGLPPKLTVLVDFEKFVSDKTDKKDERGKFWSDNVHFTPYGYDEMGSFIYKKMKYIL